MNINPVTYTIIEFTMKDDEASDLAEALYLVLDFLDDSITPLHVDHAVEIIAKFMNQMEDEGI